MSELDHIIDDIWTQFDLDKNGTISQAESVAFFNVLIVNRPDLGLTEDNHATWFSGLDADGDGTISKSELRDYLGSINYTHHHH